MFQLPLNDAILTGDFFLSDRACRSPVIQIRSQPDIYWYIKKQTYMNLISHFPIENRKASMDCLEGQRKRPYSKSILTLTLNEWRLSLSKCNSALNECSITLNEWEATLALGPFTNGTHSRNRGRV